MPRYRRIKPMDGQTYHHIISRTVGKEFYLKDVEKKKFFEILSHYSRIYFVKLIGYCIMSNHFHILIKAESELDYDDDELKRRLERYFKKKRRIDDLTILDLQKYREKFQDISEYIRSIKQTFSRWYNKMNNRTGYFWGDRFKNVIFEKGESLRACLAYIDLNPVRAKIVDLPEEYRYSSLSYRVLNKNKDDLLSFEGVFDDVEFAGSEYTEKDKIADYRRLIYKSGNAKRVIISGDGERNIEVAPSISKEIFEKELSRNFKIPEAELMLKRVRYFSNGLIVGSKGFIKENYAKFGGEYILKKDRGAYKTGVLSLFSVRHLKSP